MSKSNVVYVDFESYNQNSQQVISVQTGSGTVIEYTGEQHISEDLLTSTFTDPNPFEESTLSPTLQVVIGFGIVVGTILLMVL